MTAVQLHKLNGDSSWLVCLPKHTGSSFYNIAIDPWLHPAPQVDGLPAFSRQTRVEPAAFASLAELDHWLRRDQEHGQLDAVLFSHPFSDHLHPDTLSDRDALAVLQRATIYATRPALTALHSLNLPLDASKIVDLSPSFFKPGAKQYDFLPPGISIELLPAREWALSPAWAGLHTGILLSCSNGATRTQLLYSPHGITRQSLPESLTDSRSGGVEDKVGHGIRVLIHSFDKQTLPLIGTVACGFPNVLDLIPLFKPDLILATHDEHKRGEGIVGRLLSRQEFPLEDAQRLVKDKYPRCASTLQHLLPGESITIA